MIDTANYPKMWVAVPVVDGDYAEAKARVFRLSNTGDDAALGDIAPTGWFRVVTRANSVETLFVELYSKDGYIPSAAHYFKQNGFDADWPGSLNPDTGHCWDFSTSIN